MSKIGKKPIAVPTGVTIQVSGLTLTITGPKGVLHKTLPEGISVTLDGPVAVVATASAEPSKEERTLWGLWRALVSNMITGVSDGWKTVLEFQGVGYKAILKGSDLELSLGYSHPVTVHAPDGITFTTDKTSITVVGIDKEMVGHVASIIRSKRLPEPYKGSGIRYADEIIKKKAGKKAATAA